MLVINCVDLGLVFEWSNNPNFVIYTWVSFMNFSFDIYIDTSLHLYTMALFFSVGNEGYWIGDCGKGEETVGECGFFFLSVGKSGWVWLKIEYSWLKLKY